MEQFCATSELSFLLRLRDLLEKRHKRIVVSQVVEDSFNSAKAKIRCSGRS